jgi:hypothetical protein
MPNLFERTEPAQLKAPYGDGGHDFRGVSATTTFGAHSRVGQSALRPSRKSSVKWRSILVGRTV